MTGMVLKIPVPRVMGLRVPYQVLWRPVVAFTAELLLSRVANQSTQSIQGRRLIDMKAYSAKASVD